MAPTDTWIYKHEVFLPEEKQESGEQERPSQNIAPSRTSGIPLSDFVLQLEDYTPTVSTLYWILQGMVMEIFTFNHLLSWHIPWGNCMQVKVCFCWATRSKDNFVEILLKV